MQKSKTYLRSRIPLAIILCLSLANLFAGPKGNGNGASFTPFQATDDWEFGDPSELIPILFDTVSCAGADFEGDLEQPCPPGVNVKMRNLIWPAPIVATDPRMTGIAVYNSNANWNAEYSGPVWGTWSLYVEGDEGVWDGTWTGYRRVSMNPEECLGLPSCWVGELKLVGHGSGGIIEGLQIKASETVRTFSPLPAPYENFCLMVYGQPCSLQAVPEGILSGSILAPGNDD